MRALLLSVIFLGMSVSQASAADTTLIAAFGDSLVAGYGVAPQDAFPAQLEKKLITDGYSVKVINDGVSGDTTAGGAARAEYVVRQKPRIALIVLGGNDLLRGLPPQEVRKNLMAIMSRFHQAGIKMLIAGQKAPPALGLQYARDFNPIFCDLARQYDAVCYPFFLEGAYDQSELMQEDGMHPNPQGVARIVGRISPLLEKMIKK